ncbi:MAG: protoporphyrinogen oxidase [Actinobacteria bacterium]|nr:protoporphyrinogen oxidase [Actinomycetota bacterium]
MTTRPVATPRAVVVGGGISGLAGAHRLALAGHEVTVLEAGPRMGGKILTTRFAGRPVDEGADAFLTRMPHALDLCRQLGLDDRLVSPATSEAALWLDGKLRPLPAGLFLGAPVELGPLARSGILSPWGVARAGIEPWLPGRPLERDVSVGGLVRRRYGAEVHERLVDPLLGGINAGRSERLSVEVAAPALAAAARRSASVMRGLRADAATRPRGQPSPFAAPAGGMGELVEALAQAVSSLGAQLRLSTPVRGIERVAGGYLVRADGESLMAERVLVAVPSFVASGLLAPLSPAAGQLLAPLQYVSVAVVSLAYPAPHLSPKPTGSGFLVPRNQGRLVTACSVFSNKWPGDGAGDWVVLRASVGRDGDQRALALGDVELTERVEAEVGEALALSGAPAAVRVSRWPRAFPQFPPGHLVRQAEAVAALAADAPGVALAGAYLRGVGIATCIAGAQAAADQLSGLPG